MVINWKLYLYVTGFVSTFILGAYLGYTNGPEVTKPIGMIVTKKEIEIQEREKIVYRDRAVDRKVVTEKKADGSVTETVEEKIVEKEKSKEVESSKTETQQVSVPSFKQKDYSLGIGLVRHWDRDLMDSTLISEYSGGYRMTQSFWLKVSSIPSEKIYTLGIEFQF